MLRKIFSKVSGIPEQKLRNEALRKAAIKGNLRRVQRLLGEGAEVDYKDVNGLTPLYFAAGHGFTDIVRLLLERGADPDVGRETGLGPPLVQAAYHGYMETLKALLEHKADIDNIDYSRRTALHQAIWRGEDEAAQFLIKAGADPNTADRLGNRPLEDAIAFDHVETAQLLVSAGADVAATNEYGEDMRALARRKGQEDVVAHIDGHLREQREQAARQAAEEARRKAALDSAIADAASLNKPVKANRPASFRKNRPASG